MLNNRLCISIPVVLEQFTKQAENPELPNKESLSAPSFGVKIIKDEQGNIKFAAYYSDSGELIKKIYYKGSTVSYIEHYRNSALFSKELFKDGLLTKKTKFSPNGQTVCTIKYSYNRDGYAISINKSSGGTQYEIEYGYDELMRVNSRIIKINNKIITEQTYKYDILDRIVIYKDTNQTIKVNKVNQNNELISYTITDKAGNVIEITNKLLCSDYLGTEIDLNGHKTTVYDKSYLDNVMLKKPFVSEDDLDFTISSIFIDLDKLDNTRPNKINNSEKYNVLDAIMEENSNNLLPIIMRKKQLLFLRAS